MAPKAPSTASSPSSPSHSLLTAFFSRPSPVYISAAVLRLVLLLYGLWQDANSPLKYTDIDYLVFTDAARLSAAGASPYGRETYRYTPLLAWILAPTALGDPATPLGVALFASGKVLFAAADLVAGWLLVRILTTSSSAEGLGPGTTRLMPPERARRFAAIWLLNPMVATISTRGSSEGLLGALVAALLWAVLRRRVALAGFLLGFGVHFKIYPFIYAPAIVWWMDDERMGRAGAAAAAKDGSLLAVVKKFCSPARVQLAVVSLATFLGLNALMYSIYGFPFLQHTYLHHVTRIDHRHNFSPYNIQLYQASSPASLLPGHNGSSLPRAESLAFLPQLLLSTLLIPFVMAKKDLPTTMLAQTFAFVTFNKVCTSQYFLWYMVFLPLYLPRSSLLRRPALGCAALALWVASQGAWLQQGFRLEFLGRSTFVPGLWLSTLAFFLVNCWILGVIVGDVAEK
ncbi:uncharacterized protein E0L32_004530 [Thyridium curvatum]|uniref:GPI mannosyltransferase 1 n=1 Tax=Thyridium curvatum TaxID=1093900 RepID=A0A507B614_9PEZI|nr:uncharacterized protein E0L32_004530 [Thyridium curvatum]TPX15253.1 hypothetical protein E0L32_004530 [Thyridium curvatum]